MYIYLLVIIVVTPYWFGIVCCQIRRWPQEGSIIVYMYMHTYTHILHTFVCIYGRVVRSSGLSKTILQGTVPRSRKRERPKMQWADNVSQWTKKAWESCGILPETIDGGSNLCTVWQCSAPTTQQS